MIFPPTYTLATLIERYAEESNQDNGDIAAALCAAIRDSKLPVTARFPRDSFLDEHFAVERAPGEQSRLLTGVSELPYSVQGHIKDVAEGLAKPDARFDFRNIIVERNGFKSWLESEGTDLPSFWFPSNISSTQCPQPPTKRTNNKLKTAERNKRIHIAANELREDARRQGETATDVEISIKLAKRDWDGRKLDAKTIRRYLADE